MLLEEQEKFCIGELCMIRRPETNRCPFVVYPKRSAPVGAVGAVYSQTRDEFNTYVVFCNEMYNTPVYEVLCTNGQIGTIEKSLVYKI